MFIVRDYLAMYRTELANERTLLAYVRTFIGTFAAGVGLVKLTDEQILITIGYIMIYIAPAILIVGLIRYFYYRRKVNKSKLEGPDIPSNVPAEEIAEDITEDLKSK